MLRILYYEKSRKFCSFFLLLMLWGHLLFFCSGKGKTRAVRVIKITKRLPYGKHLDIPELFSQENKTAESCMKSWEIQRRQIRNGCPLPHPTQTEPSWWKTEKKNVLMQYDVKNWRELLFPWISWIREASEAEIGLKKKTNGRKTVCWLTQDCWLVKPSSLGCWMWTVFSTGHNPALLPRQLLLAKEMQVHLGSVLMQSLHLQTFLSFPQQMNDFHY